MRVTLNGTVKHKPQLHPNLNCKLNSVQLNGMVKSDGMVILHLHPNGMVKSNPNANTNLSPNPNCMSNLHVMGKAIKVGLKRLLHS